jgi:phosphoadenosine phosphosulfate reductase
MVTIKQLLKKHKNSVVAFSGGKDSTVVLDMVRKVDADIPAVFCDTGVEYKETYQYVKTVDNVITVKGKKTFWECVEKYGLPKQKGSGTSRGNFCCYHLKEAPMKRFVKDEKIDLIFTGMTMAESWHRHMRYTDLGDYHFVKSWNVWKFHPILTWKEKEVWDYINSNNIPHNQAYHHGHDRCGCQPCTAYCVWKEQMAKTNFKLYVKIQHLRLQNVIEDYQKE